MQDMAAYCNRTSLDIKLVGIFLTEQLWLLCSDFQHSCIQSAGLALPVGWLPSQEDLNSSSLINLLHFLSQSIEPSTHLPSIPSEAFNMFNISGAIRARNSLDVINFLSTALAIAVQSPSDKRRTQDITRPFESHATQKVSWSSTKPKLSKSPISILGTRGTSTCMARAWLDIFVTKPWVSVCVCVGKLRPLNTQLYSTVNNFGNC